VLASNKHSSLLAKSVCNKMAFCAISFCNYSIDYVVKIGAKITIVKNFFTILMEVARRWDYSWSCTIKLCVDVIKITVSLCVLHHGPLL
jgi:hypothetical protein